MAAHKPSSLAPTFARIDSLRRAHVIVAGYGPVGRLCVTQLEATGFHVTIIERNKNTVVTQHRLDKDVVLGSVTDEDTLRAAGIEQAKALIIAIPDEDEALQACRVARGLNADLFITARTNFFSKGLLCQEVGADQVVVEEVVTAEAMRRAVVDNLTRDEPSI